MALPVVFLLKQISTNNKIKFQDRPGVRMPCGRLYSGHFFLSIPQLNGLSRRMVWAFVDTRVTKMMTCRVQQVRGFKGFSRLCMQESGMFWSHTGVAQHFFCKNVIQRATREVGFTCVTFTEPIQDFLRCATKRKVHP